MGEGGGRARGGRRGRGSMFRLLGRPTNLEAEDEEENLVLARIRDLVHPRVPSSSDVRELRSRHVDVARKADASLRVGVVEIGEKEG